MSADKIKITHVEFFSEGRIDHTVLHYAEWRRNGGEVESARARLIPDDVRVALALLVAPGLVEAVTKAPEPPIKPVPDTRGQDTVSDSRSIREGKPR